ncbi:D-2-hydroxyacid dehydrogenase [Celeribacter indicus]|uniref:D-isomer specific 2-hydroxyacid dehydrogenase NAD-binding protein n=1 Tax=Celeribacter indicus TaxID=1208324 RepID=A0A0B5E353_9RHOB|nr:D-2-hydroxyacid dehydrogenase [Celeribacter indicus]AJE47815.1 D-isomer specific 2-hydroxyacid dehydrogenase NAD-binding protein [Celeribacter indicus]SDW23811.1 Phosphoglycerate dehydrogenase [Celeribacter indicus]
MRQTASPTVLFTDEIDDTHLAELREVAPRARLWRCADATEISARIGEADVVAGFVDRAALARAGRLAWVHSWAAGPNRQLYPEFVAHGAMLTSSKGNGAIPLAEHAMMLMLMLNRGALRWLDGQRERRWAPFLHGELTGLTAGLLGVGHAGTELARRCRAFGMEVIGLRRSGRPAEGVGRLYPQAQLHDFLAASDFVVVTAPLTPETQSMLGEAEFRAMKPSAHYICVSRGGIAEDAVLLRALREGWIAGAGLDAHGTEPLPPDSPFWSLPNTIVTPHNGATTALTRMRGREIFRDNLARFVSGGPLFNLVDTRAGY